MAQDGMTDVPWTSGVWLNPPAEVVVGEDGMYATAVAGSDFWRTTSYGFIRDSGHALLVGLPVGQAVEVTFSAVDLEAQFDQAGLMVRAAPEHWIKAGVEVADGLAQLGAVVTHDVSDWSVRPAPEWAGSHVTVRASRMLDSVTLRARRNDGPWEMVRLCPFGSGADVVAGPYLCAPSRAGLSVRFTRFARGPADAELHPQVPPLVL